ncbi:hypothetical protein [Streptomyces sp. KL116D]|uniref:hypothetical protein n=1 Tax=Streptomyces sp. KL116D TaxID=3045152 RepID=UPI0035578DA0
MEAQGKGAFDSSWVSVRWGDGIDTARWLYERTGDPFLTSLVEKMHHYGADWTGALPTRRQREHRPGLPRTRPVRAVGDRRRRRPRRATYRAYDQVLAEYGQFPGGGIAGDENYRPGYWRPAPGLRDLRHRRVRGQRELLTRSPATRSGPTAARTSPSSMLPAALDPQGKGIHCITSANGVDLDNARKTDGQFQNGFAMQSFQPGVDQYAAARTTSGMGWPYFTEELWLATPDGGLAAALYAACDVRAKVGADGVPVTVREETDYRSTRRSR